LKNFMNKFTNGSLASYVPNDSAIFLKYILVKMFDTFLHTCFRLHD